MIRNIYRSSRCLFSDLSLYLLKSAPAPAASNLSELDYEAKELAQSARFELLISWLKRQLQTIPYWRRGHLAYAELMLRQKNSQKAYVAATCALALSKAGKHRGEAHHLQGRALLMSREFARARDALLRASEMREPNVLLLEDLAAAELGLEHYDRVEQILARVQEGKLSQSGQVTLNFARSKL